MNNLQPRVLDGGRAIELAIGGEPHRFHALWLRDNAMDEKTRSPGNGQRLITILDIPAETRITEARDVGSGVLLRFEPEGKVVEYDAAWLAEHAYDSRDHREAGWTGTVQHSAAGSGPCAAMASR